MRMTLVSGVTALCGSLLGAVRGDVVVGALGVLASACFVITGVGRFRGRIAPLAIHLFPCLYLICKLIIDFKRWSIDPALLDYCFSLLAMICVMCATYPSTASASTRKAADYGVLVPVRRVFLHSDASRPRPTAATGQWRAGPLAVCQCLATLERPVRCINRCPGRRLAADIFMRRWFE